MQELIAITVVALCAGLVIWYNVKFRKKGSRYFWEDPIEFTSSAARTARRWHPFRPPSTPLADPYDPVITPRQPHDEFLGTKADFKHNPPTPKPKQKQKAPRPSAKRKTRRKGGRGK